MPTLANTLKKVAKSQSRSAKPVWAGPCGEGPQGGVTQGLLGRYLSCKERFRVTVIESLKAADSFSAPLEFGNLWHVCEEALASMAAGYDRIGTDDLSAKVRSGKVDVWSEPLGAYCQTLCQRYPMHREDVDHWYQFAQAMFPLYVEHWAQHPDVTDRTPLMQEKTFDVPYRLPSGRTVRLRGKFDAVDLIGKGKDAGVYLQENKTKSTINGRQIAQQLTFDLQVMYYIAALQEAVKGGKIL